MDWGPLECPSSTCLLISRSCLSPHTDWPWPFATLLSLPPPTLLCPLFPRCFNHQQQHRAWRDRDWPAGKLGSTMKWHNSQSAWIRMEQHWTWIHTSRSYTGANWSKAQQNYTHCPGRVFCFVLLLKCKFILSSFGSVDTSFSFVILWTPGGSTSINGYKECWTNCSVWTGW